MAYPGLLRNTSSTCTGFSPHFIPRISPAYRIVPFFSFLVFSHLRVAMGIRAVEDRPTPEAVYNWRLYAEAFVIATGSLLCVYVYVLI